MEDIDLILRLKKGEQGAFTVLIQTYSTRVLNTCYRFLLDQKDAEDISQEVFIEVFQSIQSFREDSSLSTWIYRIAITKSIDELRKRKRKKRLSSIGKLLQLDSVSNWLSGGAQPDAHLIEDEQMNEIQLIMDTLPENQRIAYTLSRIEGYTNGEIAEIMNTTTVAIETLIYRAKKKVQNEILLSLKTTT
ncbi:MAG: sigma-70 family RNA polymerase sigma factor [Flavobacteriia bacterium]|jgi:RNA polymerase sigma-70 factor (ECF subfamily)|nr:sigma-70 family RNA polymerase sigma factor [Crocinitomicaceae bacterium]NBV09431.1 sigma-70 family RNA polymerase sigma factor [Flavobacteriia bacterium]